MSSWPIVQKTIVGPVLCSCLGSSMLTSGSCSVKFNVSSTIMLSSVIAMVDIAEKCIRIATNRNDICFIGVVFDSHKSTTARGLIGNNFVQFLFSFVQFFRFRIKIEQIIELIISVLFYRL